MSSNTPAVSMCSGGALPTCSVPRMLQRNFMDNSPGGEYTVHRTQQRPAVLRARGPGQSARFLFFALSGIAVCRRNYAVTVTVQSSTTAPFTLKATTARPIAIVLTTKIGPSIVTETTVGSLASSDSPLLSFTCSDVPSLHETSNIALSS